MWEVIMVALGGATGAVLRYLMGAIPTPTWGQFGGHLGTLTVNVLGGLAIGLLAGGQGLPPAVQRGLIVGVLGGFTTFSAFAWETASMAGAGDHRNALLNVILNVVLTLMATWVGMNLRR